MARKKDVPDATESAAPDSAPATVHAVRCRGCSRPLPTEHPASEPPPEKIAVHCPVCQTETLWRSLAEMEPPMPEPAAESESAPEPSAASELFHGDEPKAADEPRADAAGPGPGGLAGAEPAG